jgi:hypothetical protein
MYPDNRGLMEEASSRHREEIIVLGEKGFEDAITKIESRIGTLQEIITSAQENIGRLQQQEADGTGDPERIASALRREREKVTNSTEDIEQLDRLHTRVAKTMLTTNKRVIGHVLHADPVGVSSGPEGFTIDWAVVELSDDAFDWADFKGNKVYIGTSPISLINTTLFTYTLSHRGQDRQGILPGTNVPLGCRPRWLRVPAGRPAPNLRRRTRERNAPTHAAQQPRRPRHARNQERLDHRHHRRLA